MGRKNVSDFATPVLERIACTASECPPEGLRGVSPEDLADAAPLVRGDLSTGWDCEGFSKVVILGVVSFCTASLAMQRRRRKGGDLRFLCLSWTGSSRNFGIEIIFSLRFRLS